MKTKVLHIEHPTQGLLNFVRKLRANRDAKTEALLKEKDKYFAVKKMMNTNFPD